MKGNWAVKFDETLGGKVSGHGVEIFKAMEWLMTGMIFTVGIIMFLSSAKELSNNNYETGILKFLGGVIVLQSPLIMEVLV